MQIGEIGGIEMMDAAYIYSYAFIDETGKRRKAEGHVFALSLKQALGFAEDELECYRWKNCWKFAKVIGIRIA